MVQDISRRSLITGAASIPLIGMVSSASADIITVLAAVKAGADTVTAVATAYSAVRSALNPRSGNADISKLDKKLNLIIKNQERIMQQIEALKLYFHEELWRAWKETKERDLSGMQSQFLALYKNGYDKRLRAEYIELAQEIERTTYTIGTCDYTAFPWFSAGVGMSLQLRRDTKTTRAHFEGLKEQFRMRLAVWLSSDAYPSIIQPINALKAAIAVKREHIDRLPRRREWNSHEMRGSAHDCEYRNILTIAGNIETGYSGSVDKIEKTCTFLGGPRSTAADRFSMVASVTTAEEDDSPKVDYTGIPEPLPEDSQHAEVNTLNALRSELILDLRRLRDFEYFRSQIQIAHDALSST